MKWKEYNVELVTEYAKELTWEKRYDILNDQLYVLSKQNRKLIRLKDQVDWIITDSCGGDHLLRNTLSIVLPL